MPPRIAAGVDVAGRWARAALERLVSLESPAPSVLLVGEPGTGRRHLARAFHARRHPGGRAPLEIVHSTAGREDRLYATVFGREGRRPGVRGGLYWPGAIERARGGTAVLVDMDRFPPRLVEALAAYLENGRLLPLDGDARRATGCALVATAREPGRAPLADLRGSFDLTLKVPALREREGDVEDLFWYFAKRIGFGGFPARAAEHFARLPWPGNVPELGEKVRAEAARWLDSCAAPGLSRADVEREIHRAWSPRTVPAGPTSGREGVPARGARGTKKDIILSLAREISKGTLKPDDAARRAGASVSYTRQVLRRAGVKLPLTRKA